MGVSPAVILCLVAQIVTLGLIIASHMKQTLPDGENTAPFRGVEPGKYDPNTADLGSVQLRSNKARGVNKNFNASRQHRMHFWNQRHNMTKHSQLQDNSAPLMTRTTLMQILKNIAVTVQPINYSSQHDENIGPEVGLKSPEKGQKGIVFRQNYDFGEPYKPPEQGIWVLPADRSDPIGLRVLAIRVFVVIATICAAVITALLVTLLFDSLKEHWRSIRKATTLFVFLQFYSLLVSAWMYTAISQMKLQNPQIFLVVAFIMNNFVFITWIVIHLSIPTISKRTDKIAGVGKIILMVALIFTLVALLMTVAWVFCKSSDFSIGEQNPHLFGFANANKSVGDDGFAREGTISLVAFYCSLVSLIGTALCIIVSISIAGVIRIQKALLAGVILGFLSIYFCTIYDWIIMSNKSTTVGFISHRGGPNYNIYVVEIVKYMTVHIAVILLFCSCFDFEDDEIPNDIVAVDTQNAKQEGGSQYGSKNGASSATNSRGNKSNVSGFGSKPGSMKSGGTMTKDSKMRSKTGMSSVKSGKTVSSKSSPSDFQSSSRPSSISSSSSSLDSGPPVITGQGTAQSTKMGDSAFSSKAASDSPKLNKSTRRRRKRRRRKKKKKKPTNQPPKETTDGVEYLN